MKCKNCKNKIPKGTKFCNFCGAEVKKVSRLKIFSALIVLILLAAAAAAAAFIFSGGGSNGALSNNTDGGQAASANVSGISTDDDEPELWLTVDAEDASAGRQLRVSFVVQVPDLSYKDAVIVNEEDGTELVTLTSQRKNDDGTVELYGNYSFMPDESDFMQVRAYSGDKYSQMGFISVTEPVTDEENDEFVQVYSDLADYVDRLDTENMLNSEILDAVEQWLNSNGSVAKITRDEKTVYYVTNSGIQSFFTVEIQNPFIAAAPSAVGTYNADTDTVENYDLFQTDEDALRGEDDEGITYDFSDITITNINSIFMRPTYYADDGFGSEWFDELIVDATGDAQCLDGGTFFNCRTAENVMDAIKDRKLIEYGNILLGAHGGNDGNYYFEVLDVTNKNDFKSFEEKYQSLLTKNDSDDEGNSTWKLYYGQNSEGHYYACLSARYIMEVYQNYKFDNAAFWIISCMGMSDYTFNGFLISHKAQCVIGSEESVYFLVWKALFGSVYNEMLGNDDEPERLSSAWRAGVDNSERCIYLGMENYAIEYEDFWSYYKEVYGGIDLFNKKKNEIKELTVNNRIIDEELIEEYMRYMYEIDSSVGDYVQINNVYIVPEDGKEAGSFDCTLRVSNILKHNVKSGDFAYGGTGTLSGTVKKGTAVRTIHSDGTYDDVTKADEPLAYANIAANRFLNQIFYNSDVDDYNDEATTDKDGKFTFEGIDWGLYTVDTEYSSYKGEASIILTSNSSDGGEIIAYGGNAAVSGYVQGYTDEESTETEFLERAEISLVSVDKIDGEQKKYSNYSASDGSFEIKDIEAGTYTVTISHSDYEDYTSTLTFKNGYEYVYEEDCFILENSLSDISVVLVLDVSGSMSGTPIASLKSAVNSFADSMLETENGANCKVSIAAFSGSSSVVCSSTKYRSNVYSASANLRSGGGTNFEAGLSDAYSILKAEDTAKKRILVLMSDGCPNQGKEGSSLIEYADKIKNDGIIICTQGFFSSLTSEKSNAQSLMEALASEGYHYEIDSENDLIDFYNDLADQISGQQYIHQRIACPVDVSVTYNGETLNSSEDSLCTRTSFGTLTFEEEDEAEEGTDSRIKILRLKSGVDYNVRIVGTGSGKMNYTVSYPDEDGNYSDTRKFRSIKITDDTVIDTVAGDVKKSVLSVDSDGDGKYDTVYKARANEYGKEASPYSAVYAAVGAAALLIAVLIIVLIFKIKRSK